MKRSPDNQINAFSHWHLENSMSSFFYYSRLSSAQLDRWQATTQWPIIDQYPIEQTAYRREIKDNEYKSALTNSWLVRQRNRSWIKGLGKNPQKSELVHCWQCLLSGGYWTVNPRTPRNDCVYTSQAPQWHGMRGVLTRLPPKHTKIGMHV